MEQSNELIINDHTSKLTEWIDHIRENAPFFVKNEKKTAQLVELIKQHSPLSYEQMFYFFYLIGEFGSLGYDNVSIAKPRNIHNVHMGHRNEWWNFFGSYKHQFIHLQIWRQSIVPKDKSNSFIRIELFVDGLSQHSTIVPEGDEACVNNPNLHIQFGDFYIRSVQADTLFPLIWSWKINGKHVKFRLDNEKPLCMLKSNACVTCHDGLGFKSYLYPKVTSADNEFVGQLTHSWESGFIPKGCNTTAFLHVLDSGQSLNQSQNIFITLDNNLHLWIFSGKLGRTVMSLKDGSTITIPNVSISGNEIQVGDVGKLNLTLNSTILNSFAISTMQSGTVNGELNSEKVQGVCTIEQFNEKTPDEIISRFFNSNFKLNSAKENSSQLLLLMSIWVLPLIIVISLVVFMSLLLLLLTIPSNVNNRLTSLFDQQRIRVGMLQP